jgi:hypothetical protein
MPLTVQAAAFAGFTQTLHALTAIIDKAVAQAAERKIAPEVLLAARLAPDMLPFTKQIQIACDAAKFGVARLAGVEAPKFEDNETSFADLRERIRKTVAFVNSVPAAAIDGSDDRDITVPRRDGNIVLKGEFYLKHYVHPNFYFHVTTAYALLRHCGVDLGKGDYLGALS